MRKLTPDVHRPAAVGPLRCVGLCLALGAWGFLLSACAMSIPLPGVTSDDAPTGTIKRESPSPFSAEMDGEDWRRAKSALDTALDPQGNGAKVAWDNPQSGVKGAFTPVAAPYPKDDRICRGFTAQVEIQGQAVKRLRSSACRINGGEWIIGKIMPMEGDPRSRPPREEANLAGRDSGTHLN